MIVREFEGRIVRTGERFVNVPVRCALTYDASTDPLAVSMRLHEPEYGCDVTWIVDRELLDTGRRSLTSYGQGDMKMRWMPACGQLAICLRNHDGHADLALPWAEVGQFMLDSLTEVPLGDEDPAALVDYAIAKIPDAGE